MSLYTLDEYLAFPLADPTTGGCPECGGLHYSVVNSGQRNMPCVYRCKGTELPNWQDAAFRPSCGLLFRGRPHVHFHPGNEIYPAEVWTAVQSDE